MTVAVGVVFVVFVGVVFVVGRVHAAKREQRQERTTTTDIEYSLRKNYISMND